jgi:DNA-binding beta-propeller fold protein YncE
MFRLAWLLICVAIVASMQARAAPLAPGAALVINSGEATLSVFDVASRTERQRIHVLREPHHWALSPDGAELLIGDTAANEMLFLDPSSLTIKRRITMADPYQMGFSPDGKYLVVAGLARAQVDIYDARSYALVKRIALKSMPSHIDFSPDSAAAFVTLQGTGKLAAIDLRGMAVLWTADSGPAPAGVMYHNGRVLVANMGSDNIAVMNAKTGVVERRVVIGRGVHQLFLSPDRKIIYVNSRVDSTTTALDPVTLAPIRVYKVPGGPDDMVFAPDGKIWITLRFVGKVGILDPKTGAVETLAAGRSPHGIYIQGATNSGGAR